jgi:hypothetical protein
MTPPILAALDTRQYGCEFTQILVQSRVDRSPRVLPARYPNRGVWTFQGWPTTQIVRSFVATVVCYI